MIRIVDVETERTPADYASDTVLRRSVREMQEETTAAVAALDGRTVWMVNSTASGGGVAEMLPKQVEMLRSLGVDVEWGVIEVDSPQFFEFTKEIHNRLHGTGSPEITEAERERYEAVSRDLADALGERLAPEDVLVVHDPQPLAAGALAAAEMGCPSIWRCHIGSEERSPASRAAWDFLEPWIDRYDDAVFSLPGYVPDFLAGEATLIPPAIDPYSAKNRPLKPQQAAHVLARAALVETDHPVPQFDGVAQRLQDDGSYAPATEPADFGLLFRPTVCQISRWDHLKGFVPLLEGFARLKREAASDAGTENDSEGGRGAEHRRRIETARLALVGPDPSSVADDPEGREALAELEAAWHDLDSDLRADVAVVLMPPDQFESALVINALQRCATIVAQNSLREGFGLTVTEAMWKRAVLVGSDTGGIGTQLREGTDGRLIPDAADPESVAATLDSVLGARGEWDDWSLNAQRRATEEYLLFGQVTRWLDAIGSLLE
jgi:trehalose synthase